MPGDPGATVVTNSTRVLSTLRARLPVRWTPGIPHALCRARDSVGANAKSGWCQAAGSVRRCPLLRILREGALGDSDQLSTTLMTASAKACGASWGRLCPTPPLMFRCEYLPENFLA